jgi:8-oxo-dGTP diphosphatase
LHPGKVALFGGHREGDETYLECAVRELHEELSYLIPPERFMHLKTVAGSDLDVEGGTVQGGIFVIQDIPVEDLIITEGSLLIVDKEELAKIVPALTPFALFAITLLGDRAWPPVPLAQRELRRVGLIEEGPSKQASRGILRKSQVALPGELQSNLAVRLRYGLRC